MFKNVMVYRIADGWSPSLGDVETALQAARFTPCAATQDKSIGWLEPRGQAHGPLVESVGGQWIAKLMIESKSVPGAVVRRRVDELCAEIETTTGRKPGKKERRNLQDDVLLELLPLAFAKQATVTVWIDMAQRRLVLDCASQGKADEVISALIKALPGFSIALLQTATTPQSAMTGWLLTTAPEEWPADLCIERDCMLKAVGEDASSIRYTRHTLATDDVRKHVTEGKLPTQLALSWDGRVAFVLTETLQLKKVQFLDGVMDASPADKDEDRFDTDVALATGLLTPLLDSLIEALGGEMQWGASAPVSPGTGSDTPDGETQPDDPPF
jgi:recombination associated protein RdgC